MEILTGLALYSQVLGSRFWTAVIGRSVYFDIQYIREILLIMFAFWMFLKKNRCNGKHYSGYKFFPEEELAEMQGTPASSRQKPDPLGGRPKPNAKMLGHSRLSWSDWATSSAWTMGSTGSACHALPRLPANPRIRPDVMFVAGGTLWTGTGELCLGSSRLLLLDTVDAGQSPGTLIHMNGDDFRSLRGAPNMHQLDVADLIATLSQACENGSRLGALVEVAIAELPS